MSDGGRAQPTVLSGSASPVGPCPTCDTDAFVADHSAIDLVFRCISCGTGWRFELGYVWPVDVPPATTTARAISGRKAGGAVAADHSSVLS